MVEPACPSRDLPDPHGSSPWPGRRTRSRGGRRSPTVSWPTSAAPSTATWGSRRAMPGSTRTCPRASSGPGWRRSPRTTSGSRSFRSGWTPIAPATWTSRTASGAARVLLIEDVNTIRETNNAIFNDIFWVHLAYLTADDGIERLRALLGDEGHYAAVLAGFEAIDRGRRVLEDASASAEARQMADELDLGGQRPAPRARAARLGAAPLRPPLVRVRPAHLDRLGHELRGARHAAGGRRTSPRSTSTRSPAGSRAVLRARAWPRITRYDDRWRWIVTSVVPRFRRFDADTGLIDASLRRIFDEARDYASNPCVVPRRP